MHHYTGELSVVCSLAGEILHRVGDGIGNRIRCRGVHGKFLSLCQEPLHRPDHGVMGVIPGRMCSYHAASNSSIESWMCDGGVGSSGKACSSIRR